MRLSTTDEDVLRKIRAAHERLYASPNPTVVPSPTRLPLTIEVAVRHSLNQAMGIDDGLMGLTEFDSELELRRRKAAMAKLRAARKLWEDKPKPAQYCVRTYDCLHIESVLIEDNVCGDHTMLISCPDCTKQGERYTRVRSILSNPTHVQAMLIDDLKVTYSEAVNILHMSENDARYATDRRY
jgi:hypothetical protein